MLPLQTIEEWKKTPAWSRDCVYSIVNMVGNTTLSKQQDKFCYDLYNGNFNNTDFDYLRKVDKYEYPAKIRFIPILRPRMDRLKSAETKRPFNFRAFTVDRLSIDKKTDEKAKAVVGLIYGNVLQKAQTIEQMIEQIQSKQQELSQVPEQAQQQGQRIDPKQQAELDQMNHMLKTLQAPLSIEQSITKDQLENIENYFRFTHRDFLEMITDKGLAYYVQKYDLRGKFNYGFEDKLCTDKETYFVDYHPGDEDPIVRRVTPLNFYYANDNESDWVGDCEWTLEERWLSIPQIIDEFKADLSTEQVEQLKKNSMYFAGYNNYGSAFQYDNASDYNTETSNYLYAGTADYANRVRVCYVTWMSTRQLKFKKTPNKYLSGEYYIHMITNEDQDDKVNENKGEKTEIGYVNDVWEGVMIDRNIYIRLQKRPIQLRSIDKYGKVQNPYVGKAFNGVNRKPYSLIWAAKDIQLLYNIIHYHEELWLALSGVKGFIMDKSQLPDGMGMEEWMYQRKMGVGWVQTIREGMGRQPTFNQFQHYDDTISPAIQYLQGIKANLEEMAGNITGVSRQSLGSMVSTDGKAVTEQAIQQNSMVTEIIYYEHDQTKRKVLERLANLFRIAWKDGKRGQYVIGAMAQELLDIPANTINQADYEVWMDDNGKQERALQEVRQLAFAEHSKGLISLPQIVKMYNVENLKELEVMLEKYGEMAERKAGLNAQGEQQAEMDKLKMEQEFKAMIEKDKMGLEKMAQDLDSARMTLDREKFEWEKEFKEKELGQNKFLEELKIETQAKVEMTMLTEQRDEAIEDAILAHKELRMNTEQAEKDRAHDHAHQNADRGLDHKTALLDHKIEKKKLIIDKNANIKKTPSK